MKPLHPGLLLLLLSAAGGCAHTGPSAAPQSGKPAVFLHVNIPFTSEEREAAAVRLWGDSSGFGVPILRSGEGGTRLENEEGDPVARQLRNQAEPAFQAKDFAKAESVYAEAVKAAPSDYHALLAWGEAAFYQEHFEVALERYQRAIQADPVDHRGWEYQGEVLLVLGRRKEALDAYVHALSLRPRWPMLVKAINNRSQPLRVHVAPLYASPELRMAVQPKGVVLEAGKGQHWFVYGLCKMLWASDPKFRTEQTGAPEHRFTGKEEMDCLQKLLSTYRTALAKGSVPSDPGLNAALKIQDEGLLPELLIYEVMSRADGNLGARLPEPERARLERYIREWVLLPN